MPLFGRPSPRDDQRALAARDYLARQNPCAVISLVLSVISLIECGALLIFGVAGIALGLTALYQLRHNHHPARPHGRRVAYAGIALSALSLLLAAWLYTYRPAAPTTTAPRAVNYPAP